MPFRQRDEFGTAGLDGDYFVAILPFSYLNVLQILSRSHGLVVPMFPQYRVGYTACFLPLLPHPPLVLTPPPPVPRLPAPRLWVRPGRSRG